MASVTFEDVVVDIPIYDASSRSLKNNVLAAATGGQIRPREGRGKVAIRAVDSMTLRFDHGDRVGLIGHNGAGKSTILRVISGIYEPTGGRVRVEGEVAAMFDIGFGMDPEATGWENITLRGMLLGYSKREIERRAPQIGADTGLGEFLDMPLRTYSAGMATRLAFAVSTSIRPEILLIDEGIGAGDAAFIEQAQQRLRTFIGEAGLLVMASHSNSLLREWCRTGLWLEHGRIRMQGEIAEVIAAYEKHVSAVA
ncbi:ABC transporter ATP-binding protein [Aureimonas sp. AU4]|uniref:ABC transporter ATP-binding protein n=1 Tax=Aureimonas sp. AU4 TaxID=1638163 RepID=UPI0007815391|nr:ABC transporter ATP-binding protein [Aureimonas sp. AU4]